MTAPEPSIPAPDPPLREQVGDAASILLEVPGHAEHGTAACVDLLTVDDPSSLDLLCVTLAGSPDDRVGAWRTRAGFDRPDRTWFVAAGEYARSAASGGTVTAPDGSLRIETVPHPGNLTRLGVTITEQVAALTADGGERRLSVCVHSLGTLLQFAETELVFRFLHTLTGQLENAGAVAHYHLDPAAHDERTVRTIETLFDAVVSSEDGWSVRTRP